MKKIVLIVLMFFIGNLSFSQPVALHPDNPHYFIYKGEPIILITSAEHYGAVLNLDFDYKTYLETLAREGMNYTRIFTGSYVEVPGSFGIEQNTLSPISGKYIAPWKRTGEPGSFKGENKFDLSEWDPAYFERLHDFISLASSYGIIVEVTLFCSTYQDAYWYRNPFNPFNNINGLEDFSRRQSNTLKNGKLTIFQQEMVRKIVAELDEFDNVFYEIQNEPWADDPQKTNPILWTHNPSKAGWAGWSESASEASFEWQELMAQTITDLENSLPKKHLIAQNYCNFKHSLGKVNPKVSILNFHYAWPDAVWENYGWNRPVGFDESGFSGDADNTYLRQAWSFILAGGALFNNLDYSFAVGYENGTAHNKAPGGGSKKLRKMLKWMHDFMASFDFVKMAPDHEVIVHAPGLTTQALSEKGKQYAVLFWGKSSGFVKFNLPKGKYRYEILSPIDGRPLKKGFFTHRGGEYKLIMPQFSEMAVLKMVKN